MLKVEIDTDNAAFECDSEAPRILREVANKIEAGVYDGSIFDINGNKVGSYEYDNRDALGLAQESEG